ncbi:Insulin-like growth factor 2 mRNA-binding protein 2 [Orchesella cincta]|uniref:Insulin-like growth factor 2 mRNA-binding protein 2 n=1 Tax=Orchesella cincta TaxID=48709 RepID=A0A1D2M169_ORCCI|nr:Insulin-like growth factor 2 mRNA-binding protein 2 [Orchesella cincta]
MLGGSTIRAISKGTGARLDIFRNCSRYDVPEKPVTIYGPPEKASKACKKILEIIAQEADHQPDRKGEIALRMFAQDSYIGRVIGKGGNVIKKIMDDTQTKIHVSTQSDYVGKETPGLTNRHYVQPVVERLITIRGSIEGMCKAEAIISEKLREAYQNEVRVYESGYPGGGMGSANLSGTGAARQMFSGGGGGAVGDEEYSRPSPTAVGNVRRKYNARTPFTLSSNSVGADISQYIPGGTYSTYPSSSAYLNSMAGIWNNEQQQTNLSRPETVNMYIPDDVVGALIGRKGANIRQIIQQTGASVKIMEETLIIDDNPIPSFLLTLQRRHLVCTC